MQLTNLYKECLAQYKLMEALMICSQTQPIEMGALVKLRQTWLFMDKDSKLQPCIGLITDMREAAGMPKNISYARVLWENGSHTEHYISDLIRVER